MYPVDSPYRGGTVGLPLGSTPRYHAFLNSWDTLKVPCQTLSLKMPGSNVTHNCEYIADNMQGEWLWVMGDDHVFDADLLLRLMARDVDVVVPVCARKAPPFYSVLYKHIDIPAGDALIYSWEELRRLSGLVSIAGAGSAGMLIKRHVLEALPRPRFENLRTPDNIAVGEDVSLCWKITQAGFQIWADLDETIGHIAPCTIWPVWDTDAKAWHFEGDFDGNRCRLTKLPEVAV